MFEGKRLSRPVPLFAGCGSDTHSRGYVQAAVNKIVQYCSTSVKLTENKTAVISSYPLFFNGDRAVLSMFTGGAYCTSASAAIFEPIERLEYHDIWLRQMPNFTTDEFFERWMIWHFRDDSFFEIDEKDPNKAAKPKPTKDLTSEQKQFKRRYYFPHVPSVFGQLLAIIAPTFMHSEGHVAQLIMKILKLIIDPSSAAYHIFTNNLCTMNAYLNDGNICASTTSFLDMLKEFSCIFISHVQLYIYICIYLC